MVGHTASQIGVDSLSQLHVAVEQREVDASSDAGILPLRQYAGRIGFTERFIRCLEHPGDPELIDHPFHEMVRQRIDGIPAGQELAGAAAELGGGVFEGVLFHLLGEG